MTLTDKQLQALRLIHECDVVRISGLSTGKSNNDEAVINIRTAQSLQALGLLDEQHQLTDAGLEELRGPVLAGVDLLPPFSGAIHQGCLCCPPVTAKADLSLIVAVGFGYAAITRDDEVIFEERDDDEEWHDLREFEKMAQKDPHHDWRCILDAPLRYRAYQRHAKNTWVLVESGMGFA